MPASALQQHFLARAAALLAALQLDPAAQREQQVAVNACVAALTDGLCGELLTGGRLKARLKL